MNGTAGSGFRPPCLLLDFLFLQYTARFVLKDISAPGLHFRASQPLSPQHLQHPEVSKKTTVLKKRTSLDGTTSALPLTRRVFLASLALRWQFFRFRRFILRYHFSMELTT